MVFKAKISVKIVLLAILAEFHSFRNNIFSFIVQKSSSIMHILFSPMDNKFEKSLGTFEFVDVIIIFFAEPLFTMSTSLMEFLK